MKDKLLQMRVDEEFLSKLDYLQEINGYKTNAETIRKTVEKEFRKECGVSQQYQSSGLIDDPIMLPISHNTMVKEGLYYTLGFNNDVHKCIKTGSVSNLDFYDPEFFERPITLHKPQKCIESKCGAACSVLQAREFGHDPSACPFYLYMPELFDNEQ